MPRYTTILTVFGESEPQLKTIEQTITPSASLLRRIDNVYYVQVSAKTKFTAIAVALDSQGIHYAYYFVKINDQSDLYTAGLDDDTIADLEAIALP
jgi:hypothetical protein